ncbi:hypothetical protein BDA99DRAFT_540023 [Phascolomyces articulosus]|uniref:Uncharacterized protein n=1 Tax=Phascolomyces articulosus TaxID=60185 RepID=A0AAD5PAY2_9FUNG|nr:hypothetical protein BDA99DRAFT_540023 [Phascolomyces articulosus]
MCPKWKFLVATGKWCSRMDFFPLGANRWRIMAVVVDLYSGKWNGCIYGLPKGEYIVPEYTKMSEKTTSICRCKKSLMAEMTRSICIVSRSRRGLIPSDNSRGPDTGSGDLPNGHDCRIKYFIFFKLVLDFYLLGRVLKRTHLNIFQVIFKILSNGLDTNCQCYWINAIKLVLFIRRL